jgi:hypothetical protein
MPHPACKNCLIEITNKVIDLSTSDSEEKNKLQEELKKKISHDFPTMRLPDISTEIFAIIAEKTGVKDPFRNIKRKSNQAFFQAIPAIKRAIHKLDNHKEKLKRLFLYSIAANMVDFSTGGHKVDLQQLIRDLSTFHYEGLAIDDYPILYDEIIAGEKIVYLSDNCGEAIVDNLVVDYLTEELQKKVYFGLKGGPIANDCMIEDFEKDRVQSHASVTFPVSSSFGWNLHQVTDAFKEYLQQADVLIVKGQSNFETTLNNLVRYPDYNYPSIYCILRTKCKVITERLEVPLGSNVIKRMHPINPKDKGMIREIVDYRPK